MPTVAKDCQANSFMGRAEPLRNEELNTLPPKRSGVPLAGKKALLLREALRWPLIATYAAPLCGYSSAKGAAKDCNDLANRGLLKRTALFVPGKPGRPAVAYGSAVVHPRMHFHVLYTGLARVGFEASCQQEGLHGEFFYPAEGVTAEGIIPDAAWRVSNPARSKTLLGLLEIDSGEEPLRVLMDKQRKYAPYFDRHAYRRDFGESLNGFRVCWAVSAGRCRRLLSLLEAEQADFALVTSLDAVRVYGLGAPIWHTIAGGIVDIFGRTGEKQGAKPGGKLDSSTPIGLEGNPLIPQQPSPDNDAPNTQQELGRAPGARS